MKNAMIALAALQSGMLTEEERGEAAFIVRDTLRDISDLADKEREIDALRAELERARQDIARGNGDDAALAKVAMGGAGPDCYIPAIRSIRRSLGCGLREAKAAIDRVKNTEVSQVN